MDFSEQKHQYFSLTIFFMLLFNLISYSTVNAVDYPKTNSKCSKAGQIVVGLEYQYKCVKKGKTLFWNQERLIANGKPCDQNKIVSWQGKLWVCKIPPKKFEAMTESPTTLQWFIYGLEKEYLNQAKIISTCPKSFVLGVSTGKVDRDTVVIYPIFNQSWGYSFTNYSFCKLNLELDMNISCLITGTTNQGSSFLTLNVKGNFVLGADTKFQTSLAKQDSLSRLLGKNPNELCLNYVNTTSYKPLNWGGYFEDKYFSIGSQDFDSIKFNITGGEVDFDAFPLSID